MSRGVVILLCNLTDAAAVPWVRNGYEVVMVDPQHPAGVHRHFQVTRIGATVHGAIPHLMPYISAGRVVFVMGFPVCTDAAVSGTPQWGKKFKADKYFQHKAVMLPEQCQMVGMMAGCPWVWENPVSIFASIFGKPQHTFDPWEYTQIEATDDYWKGTCLWSSEDFVMPPRCPVQRHTDAVSLARRLLGNKRRTKANVIRKLREMDLSHPALPLMVADYPDDRIHLCSPGEERGNIRSASPRGFCEALYEANAPHLRGQQLLEAA